MSEAEARTEQLWLVEWGCMDVPKYCLHDDRGRIHYPFGIDVNEDMLSQVAGLLNALEAAKAEAERACKVKDEVIANFQQSKVEYVIALETAKAALRHIANGQKYGTIYPEIARDTLARLDVSPSKAEGENDG